MNNNATGEGMNKSNNLVITVYHILDNMSIQISCTIVGRYYGVPDEQL